MPVAVETGQACQGWARAAGEGAKATWGHLGYRLGLYVIKSSKGLGNRRLRFLAGVLLRRRPNVGLALRQRGKREELERKTGPPSQTKSLVDLKKQPQHQKSKSAPFPPLQSALTWFRPTCRFPWSLLCSGNFCCKQSKWPDSKPFKLNWKPPVNFIGFGSSPEETGKSWTKCARKNPFGSAYISNCSQFTVII